MSQAHLNNHRSSVAVTVLQLARGQLDELERRELGQLISECAYCVETEPDEWYPTLVVELSAPTVIHDALESLPEWDKERLQKAFVRADANATSHDGTEAELRIRLDPEATVTPATKGLAEVVAEKNMLTSVATGGARIAEVEDIYRARRRRVRTFLKGRGIDHPIEFESLWDWYEFYRDLGGYADRRRYILEQYRSVLERLTEITARFPSREPTGWDRVDRALEKARRSLDHSQAEEDFQTVGLLCREVLISVAVAVYDASLHAPPDGVTPSNTDAKRMLEAYFSAEMSGALYEATRKHARASLDLAVALQHKRTATHRFAELCVEATSSVANVVAIISDKRSTVS